MNEVSDWKVPKWPFLVAGAALFAVAAVLACRPAHAMTQAEIFLATATAALAAVLACLPYVLEYRAVMKLIEVNALGEVAERFAETEKLAAQIGEATGQWARVQETTQGHAGQTVAAAREIAERMAKEVREFNEFQARINDSEKAALRLEVDKLRRAEGDWLQVVARILDHVFALHSAAVRTGQPELAEQIGNFQGACRDTARRVGLVPFGADPGEKFDAQKHRAHGVDHPPAEAAIAELLAPGLSFQGRMLRPALVRLQAGAEPLPAANPGPEAAAGEDPASTQLTLEA